MMAQQFGADHESEHDRLVRERRICEQQMRNHRYGFKRAATRYRDVCKKMAEEWESPSELG